MRDFIILALAFILSSPTVSISQSKHSPIKIGVSFPLTGELAFYGDAEKNGAILAAEEINAAGGIKGRHLELLIEDNSFNPTKQAMIVKKFINIDNIDALLSSWTPMTLPVVPVIEQAKLSTFTWMTTEVGNLSMFLFNMYTDMPEGARAAVRRACRDGIKSAVYLSAESNEIPSIDKVVQEESLKCGIKLSGPHKYDINTTDFRAILTRLKSAPSDAFFVMLFPQHFSTVLRQASQLGMDDRRLYDFGCAAPDKLISEGLDPIFTKMKAVSTWYTMDPEEQVAKNFMEAYRLRFNAKPQPYAAVAYVSIQIFAEAFGKCASSPSQDIRDCVAETLLKSAKQETALGSGYMDNDGDFYLPISVVHFEGDAFVYDQN